MPTDDQKQRLAELEAAGWKLCQMAPSVSEDHARSRRTPAVTLERYFRGSRIHEVGDDLDQALERAEWQQRRLEGLEAEPVPVTTGLADTNT